MLAFITRGCNKVVSRQHGAYLPMIRPAHFRHHVPRRCEVHLLTVSPRASAALRRHRRP